MGWFTDFVVVSPDKADAILDAPESFEDGAVSYDTVLDQNRLVVLWALLKGVVVREDADVTTLLGDGVWLDCLASTDGAWVFRVPEEVVSAVAADGANLEKLGARWEDAVEKLGYEFDGDVSAAEVLHELRPLCLRARASSEVLIMHECV